jgi:hypothetical protein
MRAGEYATGGRDFPPVFWLVGGGERRGVVVGERRGVVGVEECVWEKDLGGARLRVYAVAEVVAVLAEHEEAVVREQ